MGDEHDMALVTQARVSNHLSACLPARCAQAGNAQADRRHDFDDDRRTRNEYGRTEGISRFQRFVVFKPHNRNVAGKLRRYIRNNISTSMLFPGEKQPPASLLKSWLNQSPVIDKCLNTQTCN
jgi:hypothetical protein